MVSKINHFSTNLKSQKQRPVRRRGCWCTTPTARAVGGVAPLRILCIDGGGTRGLIPAIVMQKIEEICAPHRVDELFDIVDVEPECSHGEPLENGMEYCFKNRFVVE